MEKALLKKLRLDKREHRLVVNQPAELSLIFEGEFVSDRKLAPFDAVLVFVFTLIEMTEAVSTYGSLLAPDGMIILCYPKVGNKKYSAIGRDDIFPAFGLDPDGDGFLPGTPLRFNLMASFDETFTAVGLKRIDDKRTIRKPKVSQRVADYEHRIAELEALIAETAGTEAAQAFSSQTPGKKKDQARQVFSAVKDETRLRRLAVLIASLQSE